MSKRDDKLTLDLAEEVGVEWSWDNPNEELRGQLQKCEFRATDENGKVAVQLHHASFDRDVAFLCDDFSDAIEKVRLIVEDMEERQSESELYERLIAVELGDTTQGEQVSAYLRATLVAAGCRYNPELYKQMMQLLAEHSSTTQGN